MKRIYIILFACLISAFSVMAGSIKGRIADKNSKQPLEFVNVALFKQNSSNNLIKGATTDSKGQFNLSGIKNGTYNLRVSFIGYTTLNVPIVVSDKIPNVNLKTLVMDEGSVSLNEVEIVGEKSQMRLEVDKRVFNVDQNIAAAGASATEVLQNIPSVDVDTEGNISLRSNENVIIWINGRPSGLDGENRAQILEQMPAENIATIEVITNPSSKFSPEGSAGIINIILKKDRKAGYYGSVSVGGNTLGGYNAAANINMNKGKVDSYASLGVRGMRFDMDTRTERYSWAMPVPQDTLALIQSNKGNMSGPGYFGRAGATYYATEKDQIGFSAMGSLGKRDMNSTLLSEENQILIRDRHSITDSDRKMGELALDYTHKFNKTSDLKLAASFNAMQRDESVTLDQISYKETKQYTSYQGQDKNDNNQGWEFQADYSNQLSKKFKIEAGYKGNINSRNSTVNTIEGITQSTAVENPELYNKFKYNENIQALYATLTGKIKRFSLQAGLRGEYMKFDTKTETKSAQKVSPYKKEYLQLFPSLFLSYELPKNNELQLNYTRRVNRPRGWQLNSFQNITDSTSISFGNPSLKPEFTNALEMNYIKRWDLHSLSASLYYRSTDGVIQNVSYYIEPSMYSTFENVARSERAGMELIGKNRFSTYVDLTTTVNLYYYKLGSFEYKNPEAAKATHYKGNENFSWDARMILNLMFPKSYTVQLTGNYRSKQIIAQGEMSPNYSLDAGIRKSFFSKKLNIALTGRDLLDSRRRKTRTWADNFYQYSESHHSGRSVGINITYSFGTNKKSRSKPKQNESSDSMDMEMMDF